MVKSKQKKQLGDKVRKSGPLAYDIFADKLPRQTEKPNPKLKLVSEDDVQYVGPAMSAKIMSVAKKQRQEVELVDTVDGREATERKTFRKQGFADSTSDVDDDDMGSVHSDDHYDADVAVAELGRDEQEAFDKFLSVDTSARRKLADIILERITEKKTEAMSQVSNDHVQVRELDPRLVAMYKDVGVVLSTYRSGRLPKAFKIIPKLQNWEQILYLTNPDGWTAASMYEATRLFASNLNSRLCQRFYNLVLLPRLRDDIAEYKKLNPHLYQALRKALFKASAFFKGILLPLAESGTCTLKEATIFGSILTKCSVPMLHAAAAMLKIAEMEYSGGNSMFLRVLIDKKYTLPYRVIDALVFHFIKFTTDKRKMTVLWHQSLLAFVQRYKEDISSEQKEALLKLLRVHTHEQITPEIRREIVNSKCRHDEVLPATSDIDGTSQQMDLA